MDARTDRLTAVYVDLAANIADVFGMYPAACYLHERNVSLSVVCRVILEQRPRRGYGAGGTATRGQRIAKVWGVRYNPPAVNGQ